VQDIHRDIQVAKATLDILVQRATPDQKDMLDHRDIQAVRVMLDHRDTQVVQVQMV
jgi:hypothetical protein